MPRRKAFTEMGRTLGKVKIYGSRRLVYALVIILILGIGKSSLIQAILQTSPDIVHYDPP